MKFFNNFFKVVQANVGEWNQGHFLSVNHPSPLVQRLCTNPELIRFQAFNINYQHTGLFGLYFEAHGNDDYNLHIIASRVQKEWKHMAYGITEDQADRAKNIMKTNLFQNLENNTQLANHISAEVKTPHIGEYRNMIFYQKIDNPFVIMFKIKKKN